ncbi:MAG TPA: AhpC/TSA family protein [Acidimicrobiales bacterium]|nr:AhpC/TSA family protein [Acidimicrobiales bacterium]
MLERSDAFIALGFTPMAVGFSPPDALAALAAHLGWTFPFCSDEDRQLYRRLGLGRARTRQLLTPGTRAIYSAARGRGEEMHIPVEDARQLGGDALTVAGVARVVFRPDSPDDRPDMEDLLHAAREPLT